mmetsp:Transcript_18026/g.36433  ORF Transcript_18026/g.36433 Transcript_18026/m.36433 type:complete len:211 (+) Transcript_18026:668-1300(+)
MLLPIAFTSLPSISRIKSPIFSFPDCSAAPPACNLLTCRSPPSDRPRSIPSPAFASDSFSGNGMVDWRNSVTVSSRHLGSPLNVRLMRRVTVIGTPSGPTIRFATSSGESRVTSTPSTFSNTSPTARSHEKAAGPPAMTLRTISPPPSLTLMLHPIPQTRGPDPGGVAVAAPDGQKFILKVVNICLLVSPQAKNVFQILLQPEAKGFVPT